MDLTLVNGFCFLDEDRRYHTPDAVVDTIIHCLKMSFLRCQLLLSNYMLYFIELHRICVVELDRVLQLRDFQNFIDMVLQ